MVKARKWTLAKHFDGAPKAQDFKMVEEELPALKDGDILIEAHFLSVDPYMRAFSAQMPEGSVMMGSSVGKVTESKDPAYPVGCNILTYSGWVDKVIINPSKDKSASFFPLLTKCPDFSDVSISVYLGTLGMPGMTAYFGLLSILDPKPGETLLVNAAAGATGSLVGQIGKIKGLTVIGSAGTDDKVKWLKDELGFDHVFNYKTCDLDKTLKEMAPNGIDCYFDNVGGSFTHTALNHMKDQGRISVCGAIETYNDKDGTQRKDPFPAMTLIYKNLRVEGFMNTRWSDKFEGAMKEMYQWIKQGKLKYKEHVTDGFEKMPAAFGELFTGKNTGKAIVKV